MTSLRTLSLGLAHQHIRSKELLTKTEELLVFGMFLQNKQHRSVGINVYTMGAAPLTVSVENKKATARFNDFYIGWILHPLVFGDCPETMKTSVGSRLPAFTEDESEQLKGAYDFVGVINYLAVYIKENSSSLKPNLQNFEKI